MDGKSDRFLRADTRGLLLCNSNVAWCEREDFEQKQFNFSFHPRPQRGTETLSPSALLSEGWGYIPGLLAIGGDAVL